MILSEKIELIQSSSSKEILNGAANNGTPLLKLVFEIHEEVFGTACKTCSGLLPGYIQKIQNINLNNEIMSQKERKYRMKSGSVIHVRGSNKYYSDLNLTDEVAEALLKVNPNRSVLFAKIPEGALERLQKEAAEEAKAVEDAKAKEAQEAEQKKKDAEEAAQAAEQAKIDAAKKESETPAAPLQKVQEDEKEIEVKDAEDVKADAPVKEEKAAEQAEAPVEREKIDLELNMNELREKYPHIKARSKEEFLRELNA